MPIAVPLLIARVTMFPKIPCFASNGFERDLKVFDFALIQKDTSQIIFQFPEIYHNLIRLILFS